MGSCLEDSVQHPPVWEKTGFRAEILLNLFRRKPQNIGLHKAQPTFLFDRFALESTDHPLGLGIPQIRIFQKAGVAVETGDDDVQTAPLLEKVGHPGGRGCPFLCQFNDLGEPFRESVKLLFPGFHRGVEIFYAPPILLGNFSSRGKRIGNPFLLRQERGGEKGKEEQR